MDGINVNRPQWWVSPAIPALAGQHRGGRMNYAESGQQDQFARRDVELSAYDPGNCDELETRNRTHRPCRARFGVRPVAVTALAPIAHGFTHFRLDLHPVLVDIGNDHGDAVTDLGLTAVVLPVLCQPTGLSEPTATADCRCGALGLWCGAVEIGACESERMPCPA